MKKGLLVITDTWEPYFNGVITTLRETVENLRKYSDIPVWIVHARTPSYFSDTWDSNLFKYISLKELDLVYSGFKKLERLILDYNPEFIHIETEGSLGITARHFCLKHGWKFTTAYHTKHPEYLKLRYGIPIDVGYAFVRWFHKPATRVMAATTVLIDELKDHDFKNEFGIWSRGVDVEFFNPKHRSNDFLSELKPYALSVGRVAREKNIEAFLQADTSLRKVIVGDGPSRAELEKKYPDAVFLGKKFGLELAKIYANAELFVFPSIEDTFGVVLLEAMASGLRIATTPVSKHVVWRSGEKPVAALYSNMSIAITTALNFVGKDEPRKFVLKHYTQEQATKQFLSNLVSN